MSSRMQNQHETATVATETSIPPWGGLPVKEIEPEVVVASVEITAGDEPQPVAVAQPEEEPKGKRRGSKRPAAANASQAAPDAPSAPSTRTSKKKAATPTAREEAATAPPAKAKATRAKTTAKKPDSTLTIGELAANFGDHLEAVGKSRGTCLSYSIEMTTAVKHFGADTKVTSLTTKKVADYFDSDAVTKNRKGQPKDEKTVAKTRRVFRQALEWLAEVGVLETAPLPEVKKADKSKK